MDKLESFCRIAHSMGCTSMCLDVVHTHPRSGHLQFLQEIHSPISRVSPSVDPPRQPTCCQFPYLQRSACVTTTPVYLHDSRKTQIKLHPPWCQPQGSQLPLLSEAGVGHVQLLRRRPSVDQLSPSHREMSAIWPLQCKPM